MSKTVDDLIGVYIEASNAVVWEAEKRGLCPMTLDMQRAGIAAVVTALRDDFIPKCWKLAHLYVLSESDLKQMFDAILAPREGGSREAGGSTREDEKAVEAAGDKGPVTVNSPATDPAPVTIKETIAGTVLRMEQGYTGGMNDLSVTPATDPAPAVCEWTDVGDAYRSACGRSHFAWTSRDGVVVCPHCKAPIKFTEAK